MKQIKMQMLFQDYLQSGQKKAILFLYSSFQSEIKMQANRKGVFSGCSWCRDKEEGSLFFMSNYLLFIKLNQIICIE
jgi:hypothetical protein